MSAQIIARIGSCADAHAFVLQQVLFSLGRAIETRTWDRFLGNHLVTAMQHHQILESGGWIHTYSGMSQIHTVHKSPTQVTGKLHCAIHHSSTASNESLKREKKQEQCDTNAENKTPKVVLRSRVWNTSSCHQYPQKALLVSPGSLAEAKS